MTTLITVPGTTLERETSLKPEPEDQQEIDL